MPTRPKALEYYIKEIAKRLRLFSDQELAAHGLTGQQARLLYVIDLHLQAGQDITRKLLEEILTVKGPTITRMLDALAQKGFITKRHSEADARALDIGITDAGRALTARTQAAVDDCERRLIAGMTEHEITTFRRLLEKAHANLQSPHKTYQATQNERSAPP